MDLKQQSTEAERAMSESDGAEHGLVRLSVPAILRQSFLSGVLMRFAAQHPSIRVHVSFASRIGEFPKRNFDLALTARQLTDSMELESEVAHLSGWLFAAPAYLEKHSTPRTPTELKKHQCILQSPAAAGRRLSLVGPRGIERVALTGVVYSDDGLFSQQLALRGAGIALFAAMLGMDDLRRERLVRVLPDYQLPGPVLHLVIRARRRVPQRVALLANALVDAFARLSVQPGDKAG